MTFPHIFELTSCVNLLYFTFFFVKILDDKRVTVLIICCISADHCGKGLQFGKYK